MPIRGMDDKRELDQNKLQELAFLDDLTSVYNRRYLYRYLPIELKDMEKFGTGLCLFMMDVDNFKNINDTYGHLAGDKILVGIAEILRRNLREGDTIVRYAGDEFVAILPGVNEEIAISVAKRILQKIDESSFKMLEGKSEIRTTISIGLAFFPQNAIDPEQLVHQADRALYFSKRSGRNRICKVQDIPAEISQQASVDELFPCSCFIDRKNQYEKLNELLGKTKKGQTQFVLVSGDKGIGKSRLINEFAHQAQGMGINNIEVTCSCEISAQPYQILFVALEKLFDLMGEAAAEAIIKSLPEAEVIQLANYIPMLKQLLPDVLKAVKAPEEKQQEIDLFKGICHSLIYSLRERALLLTIDDFHWIDQQTLQLFNFLIKDLANLPIFVIAAYREEEWAARTDNAELIELLAQMQKNESVTELSLGSLEKKEIQQMIVAIFPNVKLKEKFVDDVYDTSEGNPLFTEEILRTLVEKKFIFFQNGKWQTKEISETLFPPLLKEAVQKRISQLDEETKPLVSAASVIGQNFEFDTLCELLGKDSGYTLEIIDRAARQKLIMPEGYFQTDKFKFNSETIHDIIYSDIDLETKQLLHRKLALIKEKRYMNNLGMALGSLGYHFAQAKEEKKADLYGQLLREKTGQMPDKEKILEFLQESLAQRLEEDAPPLSDASIKLIPAVIKALKLATLNVRLYPRHSGIRENFIDQAYQYLSEILAKDSILIVGTSENRLLINGEEISEKSTREAAAEGFIALMIDQRIKSIVFKRDLTKEQLTIFFEHFGQSYDDLIPQGGLSGILRKAEVSKIRVNEIRYAQITKLQKQKSSFEEAMLIDYLLGKVSNLGTENIKIATNAINDPKQFAQTLEKIAQTVKVEDGRDKAEAQADVVIQGLNRLNEQILIQNKDKLGQYQKNIAQALLALDHKLCSKIIQSTAASGRVGAKDIIGSVLKEFSDEEVLAMTAKEFAASGANLTNLRKLLRRFLLNSENKLNLKPKLKTKLSQLGLSEDEISWMLDDELWQELSLDEKVERIIKLSPESYLALEVSKRISNLISQLLENKQNNKAKEVIDMLLNYLEDKSSQLRSVVINDLNNISEILIIKKDFLLLEHLVEQLILRLDKEEEAQVYSLLAKVLANICVRLIKVENLIQAKGILSAFNLRLGEMNKLKDIQKKAIKASKDDIIAAPQVLALLAKLLKAKIDRHNDFWELAKIIVEIGPKTIDSMFNLAISKDFYADPFKTYALRWSIAKVLKNMSEEAVCYLKDKLVDGRLDQVKAVLELLGHMQSEGSVKYLPPLLQHQDLNLRKETIVTLGKIGGDEAIKLLFETVKDKNRQVRLATVWALANIKSPQVLNLLRPLLKDPELSDEVKKIILRIKR